MLFEKQQYQEDCVSNLINIIDKGLDFSGADFSELKPSIEGHYKDKGYKNFSITDNKRLDVLMETGTGKTFTYIQTIFELNKNFGQNRFIIIVPRNAIKAGVIQNIRDTDEYFFNKYNKHLNIIEYPKDGIAKVEHDFLGDDSRISVLVLTNSSFANKDAIINRPPEAGLLHQQGTVWDCVAGKHPVVIIDEPHILKGTQTTKSLDKLENSLFIRFGATYPTKSGHELSNVAYCLDSISAFNEYLVKRIRVNTLLSDSEVGEYQLVDISARGDKSFTIAYFLNHENYSKVLKIGDDIGAKTGLSQFNGIHAVKITANQVNLSNQTVLVLDDNKVLSEDDTRLMIRSTIDKHFDKEEKFFNQGVKTLSLFFISSVSDFRGENPRVKRLFEEEYTAKRAEILQNTTNEDYKAYLNKDFDEDGKLRVHQGYFSGDGQGKGNKDEKELADVNLILNDRASLLSTSSPLRFVFSVWALQEGWDNPNIFNICKLSRVEADVSRRQQVGRGLRIATNEAGKRLTFKHLEENEHKFYATNTLDMIVSKYELNFIEGIQSEIQQASYSLVGDTISQHILEEKGLSSKEASRLLLNLEDNNIITYNEASDDYSIESNISIYLEDSNTSVAGITPERLAEINKTVFQQNVIAVENGNSKKNRKQVKVKSALWAEFKELWETINRKSKIVYAQLEEDALIKSIAKAFKEENIPAISIKVVTKEYNSQTDTIINNQQTTLQDKVRFFSKNNYNTLIDALVKDSKFKLPLPFAVRLINALDLEKFHNNPKEATTRLKTIIADSVHQSVIQKVDYQFDNETKITSLQNDEGEYLTEFPHTVLGRQVATETAPEHLLYDTVVYDSNIERTIQLSDPETLTEGKVTVFAKLPAISIPTPYKTYSPDFAYLVTKPDGKKLFLVVEAKGYNSETEIPKPEQNKIAYAEKFFNTLQKELPDVQVAFKKRVNKTDLSTLLKEIEQGNTVSC